MKTKIAQLFFTTTLLLTLIFSTDIGGPTIPPKQPTGPAYKSVELTRDFFSSSESILKEVTKR